MHKYYRHPENVPIFYSVADNAIAATVAVEAGDYPGLCFNTQQPVAEGAAVHVKIPVGTPPFEGQAIVQWCRETEQGYEICVCFTDAEAVYSVRMVEQMCQIQHYQEHVWQEQGRRLSMEEAAAEWIEKYAWDFLH